jgi:hypothetical protein
VRPYTNILTVDREQMLGDDVRKYTMLVDISKAERTDPAAYAAFTSFWGSDVGEGETIDTTPVNMTVWVTDTGIVHQVESKSSFEDSLYRLTIVEFSTSAAYSPEVPTDFIDEG